MSATAFGIHQTVGLTHRFGPPSRGRRALRRSVAGTALCWLALTSLFAGAAAHATSCEGLFSLDEVLERAPLIVEVRLSPSEMTRYRYFHDQPPPTKKQRKRFDRFDPALDAESGSEEHRFEAYLRQIKTQQDEEGLGLDEGSIDQSLEVLRTFKGDPGGRFIRLSGSALVMPEGQKQRPGQILVVALFNPEGVGHRPVWAMLICTAVWPYLLRQGNALYRFKLDSGPRVKQRYSGYVEFAARFSNQVQALPTRNPRSR